MKPLAGENRKGKEMYTMEDGASSYRRFLEGDESAFDEVQKSILTG